MKIKPLEFLLTQKNDLLRRICFHCGLANGGKKLEIANRLNDAILVNPLIPSKKTSLNALAIDLGIKNYSYCKFQTSLTSQSPIIIHEWDKINLIDKYGLEDFSPLKISQMGSLLMNTLLHDDQKFPIDLVIIEQQRARTMGGKNVQEWTIRVNMLENVIFGVLTTMKTFNKDSFTIVSSNPKRVSDYFIKDDKKSKNIKNKRIKLVNDWVNDYITKRRSNFINFDQHFQNKIKFNFDIAETNKKQKNPIFKLIISNNQNSGKAKNDDLTDSLLHGVSWNDWLINRSIFKKLMLKDYDNLITKIDEIDKIHFKNYS